MAPYVHDSELSTLAKLVSIAYPLGDVLLLAAAIRLALDSGRRAPAFYLISSSIALLLVTDFVYGLLILHGTYAHQLWLDAGWIGFYILWGAAAMHPSMAALEQRSTPRNSMLTRFRLALLTCASLAAPVISLVHDIQRRDLDMAVVTAASITLFGLVVTRMAGLVRQQERSLARERMLSSAGAALVGAAGREEIHRVATESARSLAGPQATALLYDVADDDARRADRRRGRGRRRAPAPHRTSRGVIEITPRRARPSASSWSAAAGSCRPSRPRCARSRRRWRSRSTASRSPRRSTAGAARPGSARWSSTPAT